MKAWFIYIALVLGIFFTSCTNTEETRDVFPMQEIKGRDYEGKRFAVYRARIPLNWIRKDTFPEESLLDTTKSICEFFIPNARESIRITIHNFPSDEIDTRILPNAQLARWKRQFEVLNPAESNVDVQSFSGFSGLKFKGSGIMNNKEIMILAWALQMGNESYRLLSQQSPNSSEANLHREMRADVTIKAVGLKDEMEFYEDEIISFARSFELIDEIPSRL